MADETKDENLQKVENTDLPEKKADSETKSVTETIPESVAADQSTATPAMKDLPTAEDTPEAKSDPKSKPNPIPMDEEVLSEKAYEAATAKLLDKGHLFHTYNKATEGLVHYPKNLKLRQYAGLALLKTGAADEAKKMVQGIVNILEANDYDIKRLNHPVLTPSVIELIATIYKETWRHERRMVDLWRSRELYKHHFKLTKNLNSGANAASLSWLVKEDKAAQTLATSVINMADISTLGTGKESALTYAALGEAYLVLGDTDLSLSMFTRAQKSIDKDYSPIVSTLHHLKLLYEGGFRIPREVFDVLTPPTIVVFTGQMIDFQGQAEKRFMLELEDEVKKHIHQKLDEIDAKIGYSSASCGSDILFIECMIERGNEVNIVLPFDPEDFISSNVRPAGPRWEKRFHMALKKANSVTMATEESFLGHSMLYRFSNMVLHGMAEMRGNFLLSPPHLLAVWDSQPDSLVGGAADFIDHWPDIRTFHLIDLDDIKTAYVEEVGITPLPGHLQTIRRSQQPDFLSFEETPRIIKTLLFCDLSGFSKLQEEHIPGFLNFMTELKKTMEEIAPKPDALNTWGDAIFVVMSEASKLSEYALRLSDVIPDISKNTRGIPSINSRVSLHAGPVYQATDPFRDQVNFYGGHINRGARLEPVTVVGQVYATEQFMSLLTAEQSTQRVEMHQKGQPFIEQFGCEYVGVVELAKGFGTQPVYHLRRL